MNPSAYLGYAVAFVFIICAAAFLIAVSDIKKTVLYIVIVAASIMLILCLVQYGQAVHERATPTYNVEVYRYGWFQGFTDVKFRGQHMPGDTLYEGDSIKYVILKQY